MTIDARVVIAGAMRDVAPHLGAVLQNVGQLASQFRGAHCIFVESDSSDGTDQMLQSLQSPISFEVHTLGELQPEMPLRTQRIAHARNLYLDRVEADFADHDYLLVLDCDEAGADPIAPAALASNFQHDGWDMMCANSAHRYYDLWALRHPVWMPFDCWKMLRRNDFMSQEDAYEFFVRSRFLRLDPSLAPLRVESAFGGAALIRIDAIDGARHAWLDEDGEETCEWVSFCRQLEHVFINPAFIAQTRASPHVPGA